MNYDKQADLKHLKIQGLIYKWETKIFSLFAVKSRIEIYSVHVIYSWQYCRVTLINAIKFDNNFDSWRCLSLYLLTGR